jgi:hypothetical protein
VPVLPRLPGQVVTAVDARRLSRAISRRDGLAALVVLLEFLEPPEAVGVLLGVWPS